MEEGRLEESSKELCKTPVKPSIISMEDTSYIDLYLSVRDSPYSITQVAAQSNDLFALDNTGNILPDTTLNVQNDDCSIVLPSINPLDKTSVNETVFDPLSLTHTNLDSSGSSILNETCEEEKSRGEAEGVLNNTVVSVSDSNVHEVTTILCDESFFLPNNTARGNEILVDPFSIIDSEQDVTASIEPASIIVPKEPSNRVSVDESNCKILTSEKLCSSIKDCVMETLPGSNSVTTCSETTIQSKSPEAFICDRNLSLKDKIADKTNALPFSVTKTSDSLPEVKKNLDASLCESSHEHTSHLIRSFEENRLCSLRDSAGSHNVSKFYFDIPLENQCSSPLKFAASNKNITSAGTPLLKETNHHLHTGNSSVSSPACFSLNHSDVSLGLESRSILNIDSSGIGSLLMLSTEPNESFSSSFDTFSSSKSTVKESELGRGLGSASIDNSVDGNNLSIHLINDNRKMKSSKNLESIKTHSLRLRNQSFLNTSLIEPNISLSNCDEWLPAMKSELYELSAQIEILATKNLTLENENSALKKELECFKSNYSALKPTRDFPNEKEIAKDSSLEMPCFVENDCNFSNVESNDVKNKNVQLNNQLSEFECLRKEFNSLKLDHEVCELKFSDAQHEIDILIKKQIDYNIINNENCQLKEELNNCNSKLNEAQCKIVDLNNELSKTTTLKNDLKALNNIYKLCKLKLEDTLCQVEEQAKQLSEWDSLKNELEFAKKACSDSDISYKESLNEINRLNNILTQTRNSLSETEEKLENQSSEFQEKYFKLEYSYNKLNELLIETKDTVMRLEEEKFELEKLKEDNFTFSDYLIKLKNQLKYCNNENETLVKNNFLLKEDLNVTSCKLKDIVKENEALNTEIYESKQMLYDLLNIKNNCSFKELVEKFQKQFYDFTLLEERIEREKLINSRLKNENLSLKENNKLLSENVDRLVKELQLSIDEVHLGKENLITLEQKYQTLLSDYKRNKTEIDLMNADLINFTSKLNPHLRYSCNSLNDIFTEVSYLASQLRVYVEKNAVNQNTIDMLSQFQQFWSANKQIFADSKCLNEETRKLLKECFTPFDCDADLIATVEGLIEKCSVLKTSFGNLNLSENISIFSDILSDAIDLITGNVVLNESTLLFLKKYNENCARLSLSGGSLKEDELVTGSSKLPTESEMNLQGNNVTKEIMYCTTCDNKFKEMMSQLLMKNSQIESQNLEISNLKSRYYSKAQALDNALKERFNIKMKMEELKTELKEMRETVKSLQSVKDCCDASTQYQEEKPPEILSAPPNFVQFCKMSKLNRKLEKMQALCTSLKEESRKKDLHISSLNEKLFNLSELSSSKKRNPLAEKTNTEVLKK